jgi:hypothetical protein
VQATIPVRPFAARGRPRQPARTVLCSIANSAAQEGCHRRTKRDRRGSLRTAAGFAHDLDGGEPPQQWTIVPVRGAMGQDSPRRIARRSPSCGVVFALLSTKGSNVPDEPARHDHYWSMSRSTSVGRPDDQSGRTPTSSDARFNPVPTSPCLRRIAHAKNRQGLDAGHDLASCRAFQRETNQEQAKPTWGKSQATGPSGDDIDATNGSRVRSVARQPRRQSKSTST